MERLTEYLNEHVSMRLNKIEFERKDSVEGDSANICINDSFEISEVHEKMIAISLTRHIFCQPEGLIDIYIEFEIARYMDDEEPVVFNDFDLEKEITKENIDDIIDMNFNRASALISDITSGFGMNPLITPPMFVDEDL